MKSILVKIGKAIGILKNEGVFSGVKRVVLTAIQFLKMSRKSKPGDILFVAGGAMGDSTLYRVHYQAEELFLHGFKCSVVTQDNPWLSGYAGDFKIFIFHRVLHTPAVAKLVEEIKKQDKEIIFETDDLVYDPKYIQQVDYFKDMNALEKKLYENGVGGEILNDPYVRVCTTTTSYLAGKLKEHNKKVFVSVNKLSNKDLETAEKISSEEIKKNGDKIKIGYFSGTLSHNKDFATVTDALMQVMEKYPQVYLFLAGPLDIENKLNKYKDRVGQFPRVSRDKYFKNVVSIDINLAPLEMGDPFCESKSELKFFEPGILRVPTVAVANQTFSEAIIDGVDGFLAANEQEWAGKIGKLIEDENLRREMGKKARQKSLQNYTNKNSRNEEYYDYLKSKL